MTLPLLLVVPCITAISVNVLTAVNLQVFRQNTTDVADAVRLVGISRSVLMIVARTNLVRVTESQVSSCPTLARARVVSTLIITAVMVRTVNRGR